jgi:hypothetical protein
MPGMNQNIATRVVLPPLRPLPLMDAVRVKAAEYWLRLGEADQAVRELEALPHDAWNHPSAVAARTRALEMLVGKNESIFQECP